MSTENNVTFDDSKFKIKSRVVFGTPEVPGMIKFLVNKKIVKNERQALFIMLTVLAMVVVLSVFIVSRGLSVQPAKVDPMLISDIK